MSNQNKKFMDALTNIVALNGGTLAKTFEASGYSKSHCDAVRSGLKKLTKTFVDSIADGAGLDFEDEERLRRAADYNNLREARNRGPRKKPIKKPEHIPAAKRKAKETEWQKKAILLIAQAYAEGNLDSMTSKMICQIVKGAKQ